MLVSMDFDQTITDNAYELSQIASALSATGHRAIILTGRKPSNEKQIRDFLLQNGFPKDIEIVTNDGRDTVRTFKEKKLRELGVDLHVDNDSDLSLPAGHPTKLLSFRRQLKFGYYRP